MNVFVGLVRNSFCQDFIQCSALSKFVIFFQEKCIQYWPDAVNDPMIVDTYRLTMTEEKEHTIYVYRRITISNHKDTVMSTPFSNKN